MLNADVTRIDINVDWWKSHTDDARAHSIPDAMPCANDDASDNVTCADVKYDQMLMCMLMLDDEAFLLILVLLMLMLLM